MWLGPDKLLYGSDYGIWTPDWLIDAFMAFELPDAIARECGVTLDLEAKKKILGLNAARLYGIDIAAQKRLLPKERVAEVQACLATVMDPELDESVTELGFVTEIEVLEAGEVRIGFRLPTYWCAANFAFLMADDMRLAVQSLPWVTRVEVRLHEHMYADAINLGVAQ